MSALACVNDESNFWVASKTTIISVKSTSQAIRSKATEFEKSTSQAIRSNVTEFEKSTSQAIRSKVTEFEKSTSQAIRSKVTEFENWYKKKWNYGILNSCQFSHKKTYTCIEVMFLVW